MHTALRSHPDEGSTLHLELCTRWGLGQGVTLITPPGRRPWSGGIPGKVAEDIAALPGRGFCYEKAKNASHNPMTGGYKGFGLGGSPGLGAHALDRGSWVQIPPPVLPQERGTPTPTTSSCPRRLRMQVEMPRQASQHEHGCVAWTKC